MLQPLAQSPSPTPSGAIRLDDAVFGYGKRPAVHHLSGAFAKGALTAVVGPNGSGKSTLLKGLTGFLKPLGGSVSLGGFTPKDLAYLPQQAEIDRSFPIAVRDVVALGAWRRSGVFRAVTPDDRQKALDALAAVGLKGFEDRTIDRLSAGQFQRVLFARMMLQDRPVILLDEPFTSIDAKTTADLLRVVLDWQGQGRTVIAVLHDFDQVARHFDHTLLLAREPIAWGTTNKVLTPENLRKAAAMTEAWDQRAPFCERSRPHP